jgi:hypothetical protein
MWKIQKELFMKFSSKKISVVLSAFLIILSGIIISSDKSSSEEIPILIRLYSENVGGGRK